MASQTRMLQAFKPAFRVRPTSSPTLRLRSAQLPSRRTYADKTPVSGQPRDWTSRLPLFAVIAVFSYLPFYYLTHADKESASGNAEITKARREGDPSKEYRDPRDTSVKTLAQKKERDGVDLKSQKQGGGLNQ